jgi:hypothetical protein
MRYGRAATATLVDVSAEILGMRHSLAATCLIVAACAAASPLSAQQSPVQPKLAADLSVLGMGLITDIEPVEADGRAGAEWVIRAGSLASVDSWVVYPRGERSGRNGADATPGLCLAGPFTREERDRFYDVDGDGRDDVVRASIFPQAIVVWSLPVGGCL